ncbi:type II secretion system GspH family protein [Aquabacterium sp. A7-Y]|nr:type II secretion system GspH family protein [Aquabacterium sp. A7-Y]
MRSRQRGFTLVELLVVMAIIATLLSLVGPRYMASLDRANETVLRTNLRLTREAIDKFRADTGRYPVTLEELVQRRYLRDVPLDPMTTRNDTWVLTTPRGSPIEEGAAERGVYDVHSGAEGRGRDGTAYAAW